MKARFFAIAAMVLGLASCAKDFAPDANVAGGEVDYRLSVSAPELAATRAGDTAENPQAAKDSAFGAIDYFQGADWSKVDLRYTLEVYDYDQSGKYEGDYGKRIKDRQVQIVDSYKEVTFELRLVQGRDYHFVVFADFIEKKEDGTQVEYHTIGETLADITINNDGINNELTDAYFATRKVTPGNPTHNTETIVLTRPYAKVRVVATDLAELNLNVDPGSVKVVYNTTYPTTFNALTGAIGTEETEVSYEYEYNDGVSKDRLADHYYTAGYDSNEYKDAKDRHTHMTLFTDYILAEEDQESINFTMSVFDNSESKGLIKTVPFNTEIPVQRNHLTTIIGNVLTTATEINVSIDDNFANKVQDAPFYVEIWDGESKNEPKFDAETNTYFVARASELAWIAKYVNDGNTLKGCTVEVIAPIDLNCEEWTPIGYSETFDGTFNGNNWTIANLCIRKAKSDWFVGLFGVTNGATIKNVKLNGVFIDANADMTGALVGANYVDAVVIENVTVNGLVQIESAGAVGAVIGYAGFPNNPGNVTLKDITVNVDEESYVKGTRIIGGVVGQTNGVTTMTNIYSNIDVYAQGDKVGGIIGMIQHNSVIENCVANGNVYRLSNDLNEHNLKQIGGIAGAWENTTGKVEFVDVEFNGKLFAQDATGADMTKFDYAKFAGRGYQTVASKANGVLYINGAKWIDYNTVEVDAHDPFQSALEFEDVTISVIDDIKTNGVALEVDGKKVNVDMNGNNVVAGSDVNYAMIFDNGSEISIEESGLQSQGGGIGVVGGSNLVFNSGVVNVNSTTTNPRYNFYVVGNSTTVINDGSFDIAKLSLKRAYVYASAGSTVIINGGTFGKASTRSGYTAGILGDGEVIIYGGKFGFDPSNWVAEGYSAIQSGKTWYVVAGEAVSDPVSTADGLNDAIANAEDGETIYLADGTYAGMFDITGKNVNIVAAGNNAQIDGLVWLNNSNATIKGVKLTNANGVEHPNPTNSKYFKEINNHHPLVGAYLNTNVRFENCTFDIVGPTKYGFYGYAEINPEFVNCTFNCNKIRPIANNGDAITVTGCKFYNQYHYAVRIYENSGDRQTVVFTNNTFEGTNDKGEFEGVNISLKGSTAIVSADFTISGNTAAKYRYHKNVELATNCTGADLFEQEK